MTAPHLLPPNLRSLPAANLQLEEFSVQRWLASPLPGTPLARILEPDYFCTRAKEFHRGDVIVIFDEVEGYWLELLVRDCGRSHASVALLRKVDLPKLSQSDGETLPLGHEIRFMGPVDLWAALRGAQQLRTGFASKSEALDFLVQLLGRS